MSGFEKKVIGFCKKHYIVFAYLVITILAILVRGSMLSFVSMDYRMYLKPWLEYFETNGGLMALNNHVGDYNIPYMVIMALITYLPFNKLMLIKLVSCIFDFMLAGASCMLVWELLPNNKNAGFYMILTYGCILFLPQVIMNSALWAQCDSIYATFIVLSLAYLFKEKYTKSFILLGVAFAFKLQFIFVLPIYIVYYIVKERFSIFNFLLIPIVNYIMCLPALIAGRSFIQITQIYIGQIVSNNNRIVLNFNNLYGLLPTNTTIFCGFGIFMTILLCFMMLIYIIYKKIDLNNQKIFNLAIWFMIIATYFLPRMHDRYLFVGEILPVLYYILYRKNLLLTVSVTICAILTYFCFLFNINYEYNWFIILCYTAVVIWYSRELILMLNGNGNDSRFKF